MKVLLDTSFLMDCFRYRIGLEKIFDMYFRGNECSKGNGLGLYIVKKAAEKLNGRVTLEPTENTSFIVTLPMSQQHES